MKKGSIFLLTALAFAALLSYAEPTVFFTENFESYDTGDFLPQCETAVIYQPKHQTNFAYKVESGVMDTKCITVTKNDPDKVNSGDSGVWIPTGASEEMFTETGVMRIRLKHRSISNISGFIFGNGASGRAIWAYRNGGTFYIKRDNDGKHDIQLTGIGGDKDNELEFNIQYPSRRLINVIANGVTNTPDNFTFSNVRITHIGVAVMANGWIAEGSGYVTAVDDIEVAYEALTTPEVYVSTDPLLIGRQVASRDFVIANNGGGEFTYTVSALGDPEWLSFAPTGTCKTTKSHKVTFNRDVMGDGFYRTILTFDCSPYGVFDIPLKIRSGKVFYYEDFEQPYMQPGEIHGQQDWFGKEEGNEYSPETNEAYVNTPSDPWDGQCLTVERAGGWDGYWVPIWTPSNLIIKVSCKFRWDFANDSDHFQFRSSYWMNPAVFHIEYTSGNEIKLWGYNDTAGYPLVGEYGLPGGTWHDMSYTMDFRMHTLNELTFGDFKTNFNNMPLRKRMNDRVVPVLYYEKFGFSSGSHDDNGKLGVSIDDLLITEVERPKIAIPVYEKAVAMGGLSLYTNVLENAGAQNYKFTAEVLDYPDNLKLSRYKGSIGTKGLVLYRLDRKGLADGYYTARIKYDWVASNSTNSGSFVQLVTFGVGGWYYATEFEGEPFHLGPIDGQECWKMEYAYGDIDLRLFNGIQCLYFDQAGKAQVSAGVPAQSHYSFRCLVNLPDNNNTTYLRFCQNTGEGFLPFFIRRDRTSHEVVLGYKPAGEDDVVELMRNSTLGKWQTFSYTMDLDEANSCVTQVTLGDYVKDCYVGEIVLNTEFDGQPISSFSIEAVNDGPDEERDTGAYIKNVVVCDHTLPEPAIFGLLAVSLLLLRRK